MRPSGEILRNTIQRYVLVALFLCFQPAMATSPLFDIIEYEGEKSPVGPWLTFPKEKELTKWVREKYGRCSAIGAPRGIWRIENERLWLVGFYRCAGRILLSEAYGGSDTPIFADWITMDLIINRGRELCVVSMGQTAVQETTITLSIDRGMLKKVTEISNKDHPRLPTLEKVKKFLHEIGGDENEAKKLIEAGDFPCMPEE